MPFDLFIQPLRAEARVSANLLEREPLPSDSVVKEIASPGYRDRYAIVSGADFLQMLEVVRPKPGGAEADKLKEAVTQANGGGIGAETVLIYHWEEWESGM